MSIEDAEMLDVLERSFGRWTVEPNGGVRFKLADDPREYNSHVVARNKIRSSRLPD